jgi:hypothetical protein
MSRLFDFRLFLLMFVFGMCGGLYSSFAGALPIIFRDVPFEVIRVWYYYLWIPSVGLMFLILFVMWWVGRGINLRTELVSTSFSLFLGAWLARYVSESVGRVVWYGSTDIFFFLANIFYSAYSGLSLFFEGFTGVAIGYLTSQEVEKPAQ